MNLSIAAAQITAVPGDIPRNLSEHLRFGAVAAEQGVQLLVFPELSLTGYELALAPSNVIDPRDSLLHPLRQLAIRANMTIVAGGPVRNASGELNIAALAFRPGGDLSIYTKVHVHSSESHVFAPGSGGPLLPVDDTSAALAICADASFPQHAANAAAQGAAIYAAGVMIDEAGYARKIPLLEDYARRHRMAVLFANYSGITGGDESHGRSAIWSEEGRLVAASPGTDPAIVLASKPANGLWSGLVLEIPPRLY